MNGRIANAEKQIRELPKEEQDLLKIQRKYNISESTYNLFLEKRNEAGLIKAANVSDVLIIDKAKDIGGGKIGPNTQLNYVMAVMVGGVIPLTFVFLLRFVLYIQLLNLIYNQMLFYLNPITPKINIYY